MLVPDQHELDVGMLTDIADQVQRVAGEPEEVLHAFCCEGLCHGPPDGSARHGDDPPAIPADRE
jgi:hypothetical protein